MEFLKSVPAVSGRFVVFGLVHVVRVAGVEVLEFIQQHADNTTQHQCQHYSQTVYGNRIPSDGGFIPTGHLAEPP